MRFFMHALNRSFAAALLAVSLGGMPAFAHAFLVKSEPPVGRTVSAAPKTLVLTFTEDLEIPFCTVIVTDGMGMNDAAGNPQALPGHSNELQVPLDITMPGKIRVTWHALSVDTHKTQGSFSFTVGG
jgi:methionine-rich copper-binding protein CopC